MHARLGTLMVAALGLLAAESTWAVGRFMYVDGNVNVRNAAGVVRAARAGEEINEKETVLVGDGRAQLRFDDGGWIALQPRTVFEVKEHSPREEGNTVFALIKGGARAVTGLLADRRPARYRMETPMATVGIRGTSFTAVVCVASCTTPDGLYVTGGDGTAFVRNGFGEVDVTRGRTAYVANPQTPPQESTVKPTVEVQQTVTQETVAAASTTNPGEVLPGNLIYNASVGFVGPFTQNSITSFGIATAMSGTATGAAAGMLGSVFDSATGSISGAGHSGGAQKITHAGDSLIVVLDSQQRPFSISLSNSVDGGRLSATALTVPELSENDGILFWGRWRDATFNFDLNDPHKSATANGSATVNGYLHYLVGVPVASVPLTGSATYTFMGGSNFTTSSAAGTTGVVTGGTLTANFGSNFVTTNLAISHGGIYNASGSGPINIGNRAEFSGSGSTSGAGTHPFKFDGFFAGTGGIAPPRAGMAFKIDRPDAIVGIAGFKCASGC